MANEMLSLPPADEGERQSEEPMGHAASLRRHHRHCARQRAGDTPGLGLRALSLQTATPGCTAGGGRRDLRRPVDRAEGALIGEAGGLRCELTRFNFPFRTICVMTSRAYDVNS